MNHHAIVLLATCLLASLNALRKWGQCEIFDKMNELPHFNIQLPHENIRFLCLSMTGDAEAYGVVTATYFR